MHFGGVPSANLFVAGEMMAGNVLGKGYTAGVGMSIGTAFGRIAGTEAAKAAMKESEHMQQLEARAFAALRRKSSRQMQICNACRYCEGFCAVFPAMTRRLEFDAADVALPRQSLSQLRRLPARLPVRAAARVRGQRAARDGAGARARPIRTTPGRPRSARSTGATG